MSRPPLAAPPARSALRSARPPETGWTHPLREAKLPRNMPTAGPTGGPAANPSPAIQHQRDEILLRRRPKQTHRPGRTRSAQATPRPRHDRPAILRHPRRRDPVDQLCRPSSVARPSTRARGSYAPARSRRPHAGFRATAGRNRSRSGAGRHRASSTHPPRHAPLIGTPARCPAGPHRAPSSSSGAGGHRTTYAGSCFHTGTATRAKTGRCRARTARRATRRHSAAYTRAGSSTGRSRHSPTRSCACACSDTFSGPRTCSRTARARTDRGQAPARRSSRPEGRHRHAGQHHPLQRH